MWITSAPDWAAFSSRSRRSAGVISLVRRFRVLVDGHGLGVEVERGAALLARPVARLLAAPERHVGLAACRRRVDPDHARLDPCDEALDGARRRRVKIEAESPKRRVVRALDRLVEVAEPVHRRDRAKHLLAGKEVAIVDILEQRGRHEVAVRPDPRAAANSVPPSAAAALDRGEHVIELLL